jgi:hypothetical protein
VNVHTETLVERFLSWLDLPVKRPHEGEIFKPLPRVRDREIMGRNRKDRCEKCNGPTGIQRHHIKSRGAGGGDVPLNLIDLCVHCHDKVHRGLIGRDELLAIAAFRETTSRRIGP